MKSFLNTYEILQNRFYLLVTPAKPKNNDKRFYFSIDHDPNFMYQPFYSDFGPLSILQIHNFVHMALSYLSQHDCIIILYCSTIPQFVSNAVLLAASFRLIHLQLPSIEAYKPFTTLKFRMKPYRDASPLFSTFDLHVISCIKGLEKAIALKWYNFETFDANSWAEKEMIENGDMNWIIPNKLLAFAAPYPTNYVQGFRVCTPADIVPTFKELGITVIIRLNNKTYDENIFKEAGFKHMELFFPDGSNPPPGILQQFLNIIEGDDIVALHCKAGLGRTGTLAGCHLIKNFGFTAHEAIGWIRICRPGSIIGPQQQFLLKYEASMHKVERKVPAQPKTPTKSKKQDLPSRSAQSPVQRKRTLPPQSPSRVRPTTATKRNEVIDHPLQIKRVPTSSSVPQPRKLERAKLQKKKL